MVSAARRRSSTWDAAGGLGDHRAIVGSGLGGQIARELERQVCLVSGQTDSECRTTDESTASRPPGPPDADRDGLSDKQEKSLGTKVNVADSDGDGIPDGEEVRKYKTDPVLADTDADGLSDAEEIRSQGSLDPLKADEDEDGLLDAQELAIGTNPRRADSDLEGGGIGDGLTDLEELRLGTDPTRPDSDGDGTRDGDEQEQGSDPLNDERSRLRKLLEGGSNFVLDHPFDFLIPTGAVRSGAAKGLSKAIEKAAPKLAGIRAAKDLKSLATLRRARAKAAEELSKAAERAKASIKRANANQRGEFRPGADANPVPKNMRAESPPEKAADAAMRGRRLGHTIDKHGADNTEQLLRQAAGSGRPVGQFLDDAAAERFIAAHVDELSEGARSFDLPAGLGRIINPGGTFSPATRVRLVPSGSGVKTAYPEP